MSHLTSKFKSTPTPTFKSRTNTITNSNQANSVPSPGAYNNTYHDIATHPIPSSKFSKQKRSALPNNTDHKNPGPGSYESVPMIQKSSFNKKQVLNGGSRFLESKDITPGPNEYSIKTPEKKTPEYSIGKLQRSLKEISAANNNPSPNKYDPKPLASLSTPIGFPKDRRRPSIFSEKTPGPGSYQTDKSFLSTSFNQKKQILSKQRRSYSSARLEALPGPGAYSKPNLFAEEIRKGKGFTWQKRYSKPQTATPGPGQYESSKIFGSKFKDQGGVKMAKSQRNLWTNQVKRASHVPGPGDHESYYEQASKFRSISASKFPKTKLPHFTKPNNDVSQEFINPEKLDSGRKSTPSYSISVLQRKELTIKKATPDKFYDPNTKLTSKSQASFKIPQSERLKQKRTNKIGPGEYNTQVTMLNNKKMKFSKQKRTTFLDDVVQTKLKTFREQTYEQRQQFPNPPKYMNVYNKLHVNQSKLGKY